jgi:N-acetyl-anhydromuramyl-L-alanine amidase AmpD
LVVIHATDGPETDRRAERTAEMFALGEREASAHYVVSPTEKGAMIVQCVNEEDVAFHAPPVNAIAIGVELCGKASQTRGEWLDDASLRELRGAAELVDDICTRWGITKVKLCPGELRLPGVNGICGHVDVNRVHKLSDHYDPGPHFPWDAFINLVKGIGR